MSKKVNKATQAAQAERDAKSALDSVMTAVTGNSNPVETTADAQEEIEMERRYKDAAAAIDAQADADAVKLNAMRFAINNPPDMDNETKNAIMSQMVADANKPHNFRMAVYKKESALVTLESVAQGLDISPIRSKYAEKFDNQTLIDNLTAFETASIMETAAMPVMRVTAIARIRNNPDAMRAVKGTIMSDGSGKTYGSTKAPLSRFLADTLNLRKQQITDYMSVVENCMIGDVLKDVYSGYNFTQMSLLSHTDNPDAVAVALAGHASDSVADFKKALSAYVTANKVVDADGVIIDDKSSGQPDESAYPAFVYGIIPRMDAESAFSVITDDSDKPVIIRAPKAADAVDELRKRLNNDETMTFRLPKATYDELTRRLEKAYNPYKPVAAVVSMYNGGYLMPETFILAQVVTQGTKPTEETAKAAAKRIKTQGAILEQWLVGDVAIANTPAADTLAASALKVYADAKKRLEIPRMSAYDALKQAIDNITLKETPKA